MGAFFYCADHIRIGSNSVVNGQCLIDPRGGLKIGNNVSISMRCVILTADHDIQTPHLDGRIREVSIEDNVFVGTGATILPGVTLGYASVVAAGAVVTKDVAPYTVVAGIPAKGIATRAEPASDYNARYDRILH
jgi:maltose O-acetyltransferase